MGSYANNDRFFAKIEFTNSCWLWKGALTKAGYGMFSIKHKLIYAHRYSYMIFKGKLLNPLVVDHLCRVTNCVNPEHIEQVTFQENLRRGNHVTPIADLNRQKTHCNSGHEFDYFYTRKNGYKERGCKTCRNGFRRNLGFVL